MTRLIQNEQNNAISKHFTRPMVYTRTNSGTIFSMDVWISGCQVIFSLQNLVYTFKASNRELSSIYLRYLCNTIHHYIHVADNKELLNNNYYSSYKCCY